VQATTPKRSLRCYPSHASAEFVPKLTGKRKRVSTRRLKKSIRRLGIQFPAEDAHATHRAQIVTLL